MSETEHNKGKLTPVYQGDDLEGGAEIIYETGGMSKSKYSDTFLEDLEDTGYRTYFISGDTIYKVEYETVDNDRDVFVSSKNSDGSIDFETKYYNGGCSFNEALEEALK